MHSCESQFYANKVLFSVTLTIHLRLVNSQTYPVISLVLNHLYFLYVVLCSLQGFSFEALWLHESADYAKISSVFTFCCLRNVPRAGLTVQILRTRY